MAERARLGPSAVFGWRAVVFGWRSGLAFGQIGLADGGRRLRMVGWARLGHPLSSDGGPSSSDGGAELAFWTNRARRMAAAVFGWRSRLAFGHNRARQLMAAAVFGWRSGLAFGTIGLADGGRCLRMAERARLRKNRARRSRRRCLRMAERAPLSIAIEVASAIACLRMQERARQRRRRAPQPASAARRSRRGSSVISASRLNTRNPARSYIASARGWSSVQVCTQKRRVP